jgi:ATP-dependent helicase HrpB
VARAVTRLGALSIEERPVALQPDDPTAEVLCDQVRRQGLSRFFDDAPDLRARIATARRLDPGGDWPDVSDSALLQTLDDWLLPWLQQGSGVAQLRRLRLDQLLVQRLGWERQQRLDAWLPPSVETPAGTRRSVRYAIDADPVLSVPLQEMLGLAQGPRLMDGRLPLILELLSPAGRPLQVTADLAGFWAGAYDAVRKEMRGRYPKHFWPEDPAGAQATRFTKRRM